MRAQELHADVLHVCAGPGELRGGVGSAVGGCAHTQGIHTQGIGTQGIHT
jgi:hypothetical protein